MKVPLPDMSGPPVWWDFAVIGLALVGATSALRHRLHTPKE